MWLEQLRNMDQHTTHQANHLDIGAQYLSLTVYYSSRRIQSFAINNQMQSCIGPPSWSSVDIYDFGWLSNITNEVIIINQVTTIKGGSNLSI